jgi:hypothetical protein
VIAIVGIRLHYLNYEFISDDPTYYGAAAASCTQLEIGYSIMASIVPCLKTFMAAYERPNPNASHYHNSGNGTNYKLSSMASRSENDPNASNKSVERDLQYTGGAGKRILGKLRPEQTVYEARVTHSRIGEARRGSVDSGNSQRMIIKKGVEWSVDYDTRNTSSQGGKEEESTYAAAEDVRSER